MSQADVAVELQYFIWMIAVVFGAGVALGAIARGANRTAMMLVQATAFTAVGMLATIRPNEIDGQTGLGIPLMWFPFLLASWLGLLIGTKFRSKKPSSSEH
jgi:urea transporter